MLKRIGYSNFIILFDLEFHCFSIKIYLFQFLLFFNYYLILLIIIQIIFKNFKIFYLIANYFISIIYLNIDYLIFKLILNNKK